MNSIWAFWGWKALQRFHALNIHIHFQLWTQSHSEAEIAISFRLVKYANIIPPINKSWQLAIVGCASRRILRIIFLCHYWWWWFPQPRRLKKIDNNRRHSTAGSWPINIQHENVARSISRVRESIKPNIGERTIISNIKLRLYSKRHTTRKRRVFLAHKLTNKKITHRFPLFRPK